MPMSKQRVSLLCLLAELHFASRSEFSPSRFLTAVPRRAQDSPRAAINELWSSSVIGANCVRGKLMCDFSQFELCQSCHGSIRFRQYNTSNNVCQCQNRTAYGTHDQTGTSTLPAPNCAGVNVPTNHTEQLLKSAHDTTEANNLLGSIGT